MLRRAPPLGIDVRDGRTGYDLRNSEKWGVVDDALTKRPAFFAAQVFVQDLEGHRYAEPVSTASPRDFVMRFEDGAGLQKIVAWTTSSKEAPVESRQPKPHDIDIPVDHDGQTSVTDTYVETSVSHSTNGTVTLTITGGPQYLTLPFFCFLPFPNLSNDTGRTDRFLRSIRRAALDLGFILE